MITLEEYLIHRDKNRDHQIKEHFARQNRSQQLKILNQIEKVNFDPQYNYKQQRNKKPKLEADNVLSSQEKRIEKGDNSEFDDWEVVKNEFISEVKKII